jgi:glycosyltransferase involved in cell wall biosynthesis
MERDAPAAALAMLRAHERFSSHIGRVVASRAYSHLHALSLLEPAAYEDYRGVVIADRGAPAYPMRERVLRGIYGAEYDPVLHLPEHYMREWFHAEVKRAAVVITPSPHVADSFRELGVGDNLRTVPYGVADQALLPPPQRTPTLRIGFAGPMNRLKGFDLLVKAVASLDRCELHVAGYPGDLGAPPTWVRYHGALAPGSAMRGFLAEVDVLVQPSWLEGSSLLVYECAMLGKPLIATEYVGVPLELREAVPTFRVGDVEHLSALLDEFKDLRRREAAHRAMASSRSFIGVDAYSRRLRAALREVL